MGGDGDDGPVGRAWRAIMFASLLLLVVWPAWAQGIETGSGRLVGTLFLAGIALLVVMLMPRLRGGRRQRRTERRRREPRSRGAAAATGSRRGRIDDEADRNAARRGMHVDEKH